MRRQTWNFFSDYLNLMERDRAAYIIYIYYALSWPPCPTDLPSRGKTTAPQPSCPPTLTVCASHLGIKPRFPKLLNSPSPSSLHLFSSLSPAVPHHLLSCYLSHTFFISYDSPGNTIFCQLYAIFCLNFSSQIAYKFQGATQCCWLVIDFFRGILGSPRLTFYFLKHVMSIWPS